MITGVNFKFRWDAPSQVTIFQSSKGAIMNSKFSLVKSIALTAAIVAGVSGLARAEDDTARIGGDAYAYFNNAPIDKAPSAWRQANPNGLSNRQYEMLSSESLAYDFQPHSFDRAPSTWRRRRPHGTSRINRQRAPLRRRMKLPSLRRLPPRDGLTDAGRAFPEGQTGCLRPRLY
jgi:hypothetical protein